MINFGNLLHELIGNIFLATREQKLVAVQFGISEDAFITQIKKGFDITPSRSQEDLANAVEQVRSYLNRERFTFDLPIDLGHLTEFQQLVLFATQEIPRGQVVPYGEIARRIGNPKSVRAVGQALGQNPIPIVVPCHRVIAADGSLGGYSGGGGLDTKVKLLQLEGAML
jgi:methylated-DNA-[protein]-cysteine S-methyltransferase